MRPRWRYLVGVTLLAPGLLIVTLGQPPAAGDEPGRLGRLFRFGSSSNNASTPRVQLGARERAAAGHATGSSDQRSRNPAPRPLVRP